MAQHNQTGNAGEEIAMELLKEAGYTILEKNWRWNKAEIDIIASHEGELVFVEVKTRESDFFGRPEDFVSAKKEDMMSRAASAYMEKVAHQGEIRFDIISVIIGKSKRKVTHIKDAFFPGLR